MYALILFASLALSVVAITVAMSTKRGLGDVRAHLYRATFRPERAAGSAPEAGRGFVTQPEPFEPAATFAASERPVEDNEAPTPRRSAFDFDWEVLAGGRALNLIGAIVLVIGVGLFLKYAFDQNWIGPIARVAMGLIAGTALVVAGDRWHRGTQQRWFALGVVGAGLGILYLSGYASFASYHLVAFTLSYAFMSAVTVTGFLLALRYDSLPIALVGWTGGFLTPFVMDSGTPSQIGLASYLVLLDIGVLAVAFARSSWFALAPLTLAATYGTAFLWYQRFHEQQDVATSTIALVSLWLVFFAAGVANALQKRATEAHWTQLVGVANVVLFWSALAEVLGDNRDALAALSLLVAVFYLLAYGLTKRLAGESVWVRAQLAATAGALLVVAAAVRFHGYELATVLAAAGVAWIAAERALRLTRRSYATAREVWGVGLGTLAAALVALAGVDNVLSFTPLRLGMPSFGSRDATLACLALALVAAALLTRTFGDVPRGIRVAVRQALALVIVAFGANHARDYSLAALLAVEAGAAAAIGARTKLRDVELDGLTLFAVALLGLAAMPQTWAYPRIFDFVPLHSIRLGASLIVVAALVVGAELYRRNSSIGLWLVRNLRIAAALLAVFTAATEVRNVFELLLANLRLEVPSAAVVHAIARATNGEQLAISATWIACSIVLVSLGIRLRLRDLRIMAIGLFDLTVLKAFFVDFGSLETPYRIVCFIGLGIVLLAVSYVYQRLEQGYFPQRPRSGQERAVAA